MMILKAFRELLYRRKKEWKLLLFSEKWKKANKHNKTVPGNIFDMEKVSVGNHTYGTLNIHSYGNAEEKLSIGSFCSIAGDVHFLLSGEHTYKTLSTYPIKHFFVDGSCESLTKGPIVIEDDVWIGYGCVILSGVTIGKGSVIGAMSIVSGDIPPYSIFAGGNIMRYRFSENVIKKIITIPFSAITPAFIKENASLLEEEVTDNNVDQIVGLIEQWKEN